MNVTIELGVTFYFTKRKRRMKKCGGCILIIVPNLISGFGKS